MRAEIQKMLFDTDAYPIFWIESTKDYVHSFKLYIHDSRVSLEKIVFDNQYYIFRIWSGRSNVPRSVGKEKSRV